MNEISLHFSKKDISNKFLEIQKLDDKPKEKALISIYHSLLSDLASACSNLWTTNNRYNEIYMTSKEAFYERYGPNLTKFQSAYVENVQGKILLIGQSLKNIDKICSNKELTSQTTSDLESNSRDILDRLESIIEYYPIKDNLLKIGELSSRRLEFCKIADACINDGIYRYNNTFAPEFQKKIYSLKYDIDTYWTEQFQKPSNNRYGLMKSGITDIKGKTDYFKNVIMPIIQNINHHASNPENDIYSRLKANNMDGSIFISSEIDENKKSITYKIRDDGVGVRPEIIDKLFDKGFTTKKDKTIEHGIGLWAVKNFIEENGGKIWCESELGKYTQFSFTIPYDRKEIDAYVKD